MSDVFEEFQSILSLDSSRYNAFRFMLKRKQAELSSLELARSHALMRLSLAVEQLLENKKGVADVRVLVRQVIRSYNRRLTIPRPLWNLICKDEYELGLRVVDEYSDGTIQLTADTWRPTWLKNTEHLDTLALRRNDKHVIGDGLLSSMTRGEFESYQSLAQQIAVQACLFAMPGSTLLVTLPTGAGKSHCVLLPAWQASQGGRVGGGTTLVVVPTVSLAIDLEKRALTYFTDTPASEYAPYSWTSSTPEETRATIIRGIQYGTLPILYVSPEALMQSQLHDVCLEAARQGTINWLVIDEAHLIETWGAGFRTDFQFLSGYRKQLLACSEDKLRTLLLSATISSKSAELLERLFSEKEHFCVVQANRLRSELSYWFKFSQHPYTRQTRVLEALRYLPRPAILYVSTLEDAREWLKILRQQDFQRIAMFTGETEDRMRQKLVYAWSNNELDIMVATSAFGVGIDKSDIRTIIHACLPESIDRFYQEVGRAGRDGYSAISLVCPTVHDFGVATTITRSALITYEKGMYRWEGMRRTGIFSKIHGDIQLVDTNTPPSDKPDMRRGKSNREWNEHTLLLMQRAGLLYIMDAREEEFQNIESNAAIDTAWLQIKLLEPPITAHPESEEFRNNFEEKRGEEQLRIKQSLEKMENLIKKYDEEVTKAERCIAYSFSSLYPGSVRACGGCAYCRTHGVAPYANALPLETDISLNSATQVHLHGELLLRMGWQKVLNLIWKGPTSAESLTQLNKVLVELVGAGLQQLFLPSELLQNESWMHQLVKGLTKHLSIPHILRFIDDELEQKQLPLYSVPTVVVYPSSNYEADDFHRLFRHQLKQWQDAHVPLIFVVLPNLYLESERGTFIDRMDGITYYISDLHKLLTEWQEPVL